MARGAELSPAELDAIEARWASAWTPHQVAERLAGVAAPWCVAAGWALDLFLGTRTRPHPDLEIAVPAGSFAEVRDRFPGHAVDAVGSGRIWPDATPAEPDATHQTWLRDPVTGDYVVDVFREPHDGATWVCRHDETIRLPYREVVRHTADGVPCLAPELVLLFKAKHARPKDVADLATTLPRLSAAQRTRFGELVAHVYPEHPWLTRL